MLAVVAAVVALAWYSGASHAAPVTLNVNTIAGNNDHDCEPLIIDDCSLLEALNDPKVQSGTDPVTIRFLPSVFGSNSHITPDAPLPLIDAARLGGFTLDATGTNISIDKGNCCFNTDGIDIRGSPTSPISIINVDFLFWDRAGIYICGGLNGGYCPDGLSNVTLTNAGANFSDLTGIAIRGSDVSNVQITDVEIHENGTGAPEGPGQGVYIQGYSSLSGVTITGGDTRGSEGNGVWMSGGTISNINIAGLESEMNKGRGVYIFAENSGISGVHVSGYYGHDNLNDALNVTAFAGVTGLTIDGNSVLQDNGSGATIAAGSGLNNISITGSHFNRNNAGISVDSASKIENTVIEMNTATGNRSGVWFSDMGGAGSGGNFIRQNQIGGSLADGIDVYGGSVTISRNTTYLNGGIGIDLVDAGDPSSGVTPNDAGDGDSGPNGLLNYPVIVDSTAQEVTGTACGGCLVELFMSDGNFSGYGDGNGFLGDAFADDLGNFTISICGKIQNSGTPMTATATDIFGNTSEFSYRFVPDDALEDCPTATLSPTPFASPTPTATPSPSPSPTLAPGQRKQGDLNCDGKIDGLDALLAVLAKFELTLPAGADCTPIGQGSPKFGNVNCSGAVDEGDALAILAFVAKVTPLPQQPGCKALGQLLS